ncbi:RhoGEF domain containing protein [Balamuthia mandrillaris]
MEKEKETSKKKKSGGNPKPMLSRSRSLQSMKGAYLLAKKSASPNNNGNATSSGPHTSATTTLISTAPAVATPTTEARGNKKKRSATTKEKKKVQKKKDKDKDKDSVLHQTVDATATTEPAELKTSSPTSPRRKKGFGRSSDFQANNALPRAHSLQVFSGSISAAPENDDDPLLQPRDPTSGGGSLKSNLPVSRPSVVPALTDLSSSKSASPRTPSATAMVSPRNSPRHQQHLPPPPQKPPPLELPAFSASNSGLSLSPISPTKQQTSPTTPSPTVIPGSPPSSPRCSPRSPPSSALGSSSTSSPRSPHSRSAHASDSHIKRVPPSPKSRSDESVRGGSSATTTGNDSNSDQEVDLVFLPSISAQALPPPLSLASLDILPPPSSVPPPIKSPSSSSASLLSPQGVTGGTGSPRSSLPSLSSPLSSVPPSIPPSSPISFSPSSVAIKSPRERGVSLPPALIRSNSSDVHHSPSLSHSLPHSSSSSSLSSSSSVPPSSPSKRDRKEKREKKEHRKKDRSHSLNVSSLSSSSSSGERSSKRKGSGSSSSPTGSPSPLACSRTLRRGSKSEIHKEALPSSLLSSSPPSFPSSLSCSSLSSSSYPPSASSSLSSSTKSSPPQTPTLFSNSTSVSPTAVAEERTIIEEEHSEQEASSKLSSSTSSLPSLSPSSSPATLSLSTSGSSISTTAASASTANIPDKRERTRKEAINEIVNTERDYVRDMQLVIQVFLAPLKEKQLMEPQKLSTIFSNVELLVGVNEEMLKSFDRTAHKDQEEMIGDTFLSVMHYFKMYTVYCSNQPLALKTLAEMKQTNRPFVQFLQECIDNPACRGLDLFSYLIKPVQRICKYPLLLRTLLEVTQETHKDYRNLKKAEEDMEKLVQYVNEGNREAENRQKILELQNSIDGGDTLGLVQPTRRYLMEELLDVCKNGKRSKSKDLQRRCVLFNDMLLLLKVRKEGYIAPVQIDLSNEHIKLFDVGDTEKIKNAFDLKDVKRKKMFTFCFPSAQMKSQWLKAIKSIINTHQMKRFMQAEEQAQLEKVEREQFQLLQQHNSVTFGAAESNAARAVGFAVSDLKDANSVLKQSSSSSALSSSATPAQPENSCLSVDVPDTTNKIPAAVTVNKRAKFQRSMSLNSMQNMKIESTKKASTTPTGGEEQPQQPPTPSSSTKRTPRAQHSQDEIAAAASSSGKHGSVNNKQTGEKKARVLSPRQESSPSMLVPTSPRNRSTPLSPRERNSSNNKERCERRDSKEERKRANKTKDSASKAKEQDQEKKHDRLVDEAVGEGDKPEEEEPRVEETRKEEGKPGEALTDQDPILLNAS